MEQRDRNKSGHSHPLGANISNLGWETVFESVFMQIAGTHKETASTLNYFGCRDSSYVACTHIASKLINKTGVM